MTDSLPNTDRSDNQPAFDLELAYPSTRICWDRIRWYHALWILYVPIGLLLAISRLLILYMCHFINIVSKKQVISLAEVFGWIGYSFTISKLSSMVDFKGLPPNSHIIMEHHGIHDLLPLFQLNSDATCVIGAKVSSFTKYVPWLKTLVKPKGVKLEETYRVWRSKNPNDALIVFPQGSSCDENVVTMFMDPMFEAMDPDAVIVPVSKKLSIPIPLNMRCLNGNLFVDYFLLMGTPNWNDETRSEFACSNEAASVIGNQIASGFNKPYLQIPVYEKFAYEHRMRDGHFLELKWIRQLQSNSTLFNVLYYPFSVLHYIFQVYILIFFYAILLALDYDPGLLWALAGSVALSHVLISVVKYWFHVPRPVWIDPHGLRITRLVWEHDYSFPSGHSGMVASVFSAILLHLYSFKGVPFPDVYFVPAVYISFLVAVITGVSRCFTGMHFVSDVAAGFLMGIFTSAAWILTNADVNFLILVAEHPQYVLAIVIALSLALALVYISLYQRIHRDAVHLKRIQYWSDNLVSVLNAETFSDRKLAKSIVSHNIEPHRMLSVYYSWGVVVGVFLTPPLQRLWGPAEIFASRLECAKDYALSLALTFVGAFALLAVLLKFPKTLVATRAVLFAIVILWISLFSKRVLQFFQSQYHC
ncbi:hypothetical protein BDR26DRAFT_1007499 [Obelidium mucronatum]|nr:hypothetical protein BDR26DRAFT_1007499 [Obelidium mucronatum]